MKKIALLFLMLTLLLFICSCESNDVKISDSIVKQENTTESETLIQTTTLSETDENKLILDKISIEIYGKKNLPKNYDAGRYSDFIELDYKVHNGTSKTIKGIKGVLIVKDQFDEEFMQIQWDISEGKIPSGETKKITDCGIEYNQFNDSHQKLYSLALEDLIFEYNIEQVNFSDGTKIIV